MAEVTVPAPQPRPLWRAEDVAEYLAVPIKTLYKWRLERHGPPCARVGSTCATSRTMSSRGSRVASRSVPEGGG